MTKYEMLLKADKVFNDRLNRDMRIHNLLELMRTGEATQEHAAKYARRVGEICSSSLKSVIGDVETLPGGVLPADYAEYMLNERLRADHYLIEDYAKTVQDNIYKTQGLGIKSLTTDFSQNRANGLVEKITGANTTELAQWFGDPLVNFDCSTFDDWVRKNVEAVYEAGYPAIVRRTMGPPTVRRYKEVRGEHTYIHERSLPCKMCQSVAGDYRYGDQPPYFFSRHEGCRCVVIYSNGNTIEDVWTHKEASDDVKKRAAYGLDVTRLNDYDALEKRREEMAKKQGE